MPPSKTESAKRARKVLSIKEKMELINEYSKRKVPFKMLSEKYGVGIQTISDLIKNNDRILKFCSDTDSMFGPKHRYFDMLILQHMNGFGKKDLRQVS